MFVYEIKLLYGYKIYKVTKAVPIFLFSTILSTYYINTELLPIEYRDHSIEPEFAWFYNITSNNIKIEEYHWDIKVMRNDLSEIKNNDFSYEIY